MERLETDAVRSRFSGELNRNLPLFCRTIFVLHFREQRSVRACRYGTEFGTGRRPPSLSDSTLLGANRSITGRARGRVKGPIPVRQLGQPNRVHRCDGR